MGYVVNVCAATTPGVDEHWLRKRWRSDDPWGAIYRAIHDAMSPHVGKETDIRSTRVVCTLAVVLSFEPDAEDAELARDRPGVARAGLIANKPPPFWRTDS
jgi:hypothetical protein